MNWKWIINFEDIHWKANQSSKKIHAETILARNGTGKTTTLLLLQHLFANEELSEDLLERVKYRGLLSTKEIKKIDGVPEFSVDIKIGTKTWTLGYKFDNKFSTATIFTQAPEGYYDSYEMHAEFSTAFENNHELTKLLFFDTQGAGSDGRRMNKKTIDETMKILANIKVLDHARETYIPDFIEAERKKSDKKGSETEKKLAEQAMKRCKSTIKQLNEKLKKAEEDLGSKREQLDKVKENIKGAHDNSKFRDAFKETELLLLKARNKVKGTTKELLNALMDPANLSSKLWRPVQDYYQQLSKSRIPTAIASEYLSSVLYEGECICGNEIHGKEEKNIKERMNKSMGLAILSEVYIMKDKVKDSKVTSDISLLGSRLETERTARDKLETKLARLEGQLGKKERKTLDELGKSQQRLEDLISELEDNIEMYSCNAMGKIRSNKKVWLERSMTIGGDTASKPEYIGECKNIYWLKQIKNNLDKKLSSIAGIEDLSNAGEAITDVFEAVEIEVLAHIQNQVITESTKHLAKYNMQNELRIHSLSNGLACVDANGNVQKGFSTGEELAIVFSFISALSKVTELSVPMIVDNPTKGADPSKLRGIQDSLQGFNHQLILFIYATERNTLPSYFNKKNVNPCTLMRENEKMDGTDGKKRGRYKINYDWKTFDNYHPPTKEGV